MTAPDDPVVRALLDSYRELLGASRRLTNLGDRLLTRATREPLTPAEATDARQELDTAREAIERLDSLLVLWNQGLRRM